MSNSQQRASLGLDDEQEQIDLEQLMGGYQAPLTPEQQKKILDAGMKAGFVSRQPTRHRRRSPYTAQFGGKCREGIKPLFQEVAKRLGLHDTQALEATILALIEKEGFDDLKQKYTEIVKRPNLMKT